MAVQLANVIMWPLRALGRLCAWLLPGLPENEPGLSEAERQARYDARQW